jgi:hypothetical protein
LLFVDGVEVIRTNADVVLAHPDQRFHLLARRIRVLPSVAVGVRDIGLGNDLPVIVAENGFDLLCSSVLNVHC